MGVYGTVKGWVGTGREWYGWTTGEEGREGEDNEGGKKGVLEGVETKGAKKEVVVEGKKRWGWA